MPENKKQVTAENKARLMERLIDIYKHLKEEDNATAIRMYNKIITSQPNG
jgi:hypothetical protein